MAKAPAVQFYSGDFLTGTTLMTNEEVGLYIRLLCLQAENGSVPDDPERMSLVYGPSVLKVWPAVRSKFVTGQEAGTMVNEKMVKVLADREAFRKKQSEKGKASAEARSSSGSKKKKPRPNHGSTTVEPLGGRGRDIGITQEGKEHATKLQWPWWASSNVLKAWEEFKAYRWVEHKAKYQSPTTEQHAVNLLAKYYSKGEECFDGLNLAMAKGWRFPVDPKDLAPKQANGKPVETPSPTAKPWIQ
jgi:uncharacterized protein YdaU (DUF1376 family)